MRTRHSLMLVCMLFSLAGCGAIQRQQLMKNDFPYYPREVQEAITAGRIMEGMTHQEVFLAVGATLCQASSYYKGRSAEVWSYESNPFTGRAIGGTTDCYRARHRVYFEDGRVAGWDNMEGQYAESTGTRAQIDTSPENNYGLGPSPE